MPKKLKKDVLDFTTAGITLGVGSVIGAGIQSKAPAGTPSVTGGFAAMGSMMPIAGTAIMGKNLIRLTKKIKR
ncbi:unnamed protein product, partial [marine sediment metagenome]